MAIGCPIRTVKIGAEAADDRSADLHGLDLLFRSWGKRGGWKR